MVPAGVVVIPSKREGFPYLDIKDITGQDYLVCGTVCVLPLTLTKYWIDLRSDSLSC